MNIPPNVIAIGDLEWYNGFDYLLAALALVKRHNIEFRASIVGTGELDTALRFSTDDLDLRENVEICSQEDDVKLHFYIEAADIIVFSSHKSPSIQLIERAMVSGLPIVTTNVPGISEKIRDGIDGFIVPVRDTELLARRIEQLLTDPRLRKIIGQAAQLSVQANLGKYSQALD